MQTLEVIMAGEKTVEDQAVVLIDKTDDFSKILSNVINDPSIAKTEEVKPVIKEEIKPVEEIKIADSVKAVTQEEIKPVIKEEIKTIEEIKKEDSVKAVSKEEIKPVDETKKEDVKPIIKEEIKPVEEIKKDEPVIPVSQITKLLSSAGADGTEMIYIDVVNGKPDTVRLFIPVEIVPVVIQPEMKAEEPKIEIKQEEEKKTETKFIDIELPNPNARVDSISTPVVPIVITEKKVDTVKAPEPVKENIVKPLMINSDCKNFATEDDFLKLRKKMAAENNDDGMITIAKKTFKSKCFTTEQVKNLSVLFLKDEGKYKIFDAAYPFVSDSYNFGSLETQLTDTYFVNRFKVMIRH
ncbi:MAG: DUF4476 domain-containing protein [Ferruginibacter sp.]|nr:DUF4476 domain-containing protein [Ferruginibacter sp.]